MTYDPRFPYGCRAAGFKSRLLPSREMAASSGIACQCFALKKR
ncbi:MAG: uracil-DNA glycosylase [Deltaproteobacteria bacterium]|nr:uracil-DNA glycosylase [Deltaproteobacteria bacterium]